MYIGNQPLSVAFLTDQFSGNGSTTAFTLSVAPANTGSILVAVSGVLQDPSTYAVTNTTLTFSAAPPAGTGNISVRYLGIPASGVTTTAYRTVTEFTATAGQTTFSVPSYTVGYIDVYRNGVRLGAADYTATSGTSVILANPCTAGDLVVTESFYVSSVLNAIPATAGAVGTTSLAEQSVTRTKMGYSGAILQVLQSAKTNGTVVSLTANTFAEIDTAFRVTITPTASTTKMLVTCHISGGCTTGTPRFLVQYSTDGGTNWSNVSPVGNTNSSHGVGHFGMPTNGDPNQFITVGMELLHTPATSSPIIYRVMVGGDVTGAQYFINRSPNYLNTFLGATLVSTLTIKELVG